MKRTVKIFHASDIHGSNKCFKKFLNTPKAFGVDVLILGGDITGKALIPIIESPNGQFKTEYLGRETTLKNKQELNEMVQLISDSGAYPLLCDPDEHEKLTNDPVYRETLFKKLIVQRVKEWVTLAEERLAGTGVETYIMPGNDDYFEIDEVLNHSRYVINPENRVVKVAEKYEMISSGYVNMTPWKAPRDIPDEKLEQIIEGMAGQLTDPKNAIFDLHAPPYNCSIDQAPLLDETLKPVIKGGEIVMTHVGSLAVRKAIEKHQPLLGLHGHIHESRGVAKIGRTICINGGSDYASGSLYGAVIVLENGKVKSYLLTVG